MKIVLELDKDLVERAKKLLKPGEVMQDLFNQMFEETRKMTDEEFRDFMDRGKEG